jgi:hypothetical protein
MLLSTGTRLGPYATLSPVGAGGMGEVFKTRDSGELVCYDCVREWWPHRCAEFSVKDREAIERKLVHWLATHNHGEIIRDPKKRPENQPEDCSLKRGGP